MNAVAPIRRRPEATRAQIVEAAIQTAQATGAANFTLDAVVSRLALSKGALLHHFPTKTALLEAVIDHMGQAFTEAVKAEAALDPQPYCREARAYLKVTVGDVSGAGHASVGKAVLVACLLEPGLAMRWRGWVDQITVNDPADPAGADDALILRLVADGLWLSDVLGAPQIDLEQRQALASILAPAPPSAGKPAPI